MAFEAACANCAHWSAAKCGIGQTLPPGEPRCDRYAIGDAFASQIAGAFLKESTIAVPVPLRPLPRPAKGQRPRRRGFRS